MTGPLLPHRLTVSRYAHGRYKQSDRKTVGRCAQGWWQKVRDGKSVAGKLTMRSTKGFLVRASGGRYGKEGEEGELEKDSELARKR